jgi:hypothetical protein
VSAASEPPTAAAFQLYTDTLLDAELRDLRVTYCRAVCATLESIAGWLGVDSYLGAGDVSADDLAASAATTDRERYAAFRVVAAVTEMAAELASGASRCWMPNFGTRPARWFAN